LFQSFLSRGSSLGGRFELKRHEQDVEGWERLVEILADDERVHGAFGYESGARCVELLSLLAGGSQPNPRLAYPIEV
jgi:hypothetical protein